METSEHGKVTSVSNKAVTMVDREPNADDTALIRVIERAASNPDVDVEKMERLLALQERVMDRRSASAFWTAFAQMQNDLPTIDEHGAIKGRSGDIQSRYAKWPDINAAIKPVLREWGFALSFRTAFPGKEVIVTGVLSHQQGHREESVMVLPADVSGNKNSVQAWGSSISYGKRYMAIALLNITSRAKEDEDDDGQAAGGDTLTEQQLTELKQKAKEHSVNEAAYLRSQKVETWEQIPASRFRAVLQQLEDIGKARGGKQP